MSTIGEDDKKVWFVFAPYRKEGPLPLETVVKDFIKFVSNIVRGLIGVLCTLQ
jgi:hypothetical protein